jgi:hypothetical protein
MAGSPSLVRLKDKLVRMQATTRRAREKAGEVAENIVGSATTVGSAFAIGAAQGYLGEEKMRVFNVPVPLIVGLGAHLAAIVGTGGQGETHLRNIGNGALAAYASFAGLKMAARQKNRQIMLGDEGQQQFVVGRDPVQELLSVSGDDSLQGGLSSADLSEVLR